MHTEPSFIATLRPAKRFGLYNRAERRGEDRRERLRRHLVWFETELEKPDTKLAIGRWAHGLNVCAFVLWGFLRAKRENRLPEEIAFFCASPNRLLTIAKAIYERIREDAEKRKATGVMYDALIKRPFALFRKACLEAKAEGLFERRSL